MIISKFQLDRNKNINSLLKDLKFFISKSVSTRRIKWYLKKLSKIFDIPQSTLNKETKIVLYNNFENLNGKINKKFLLRNLFFYSIKFIALSIFILVFSKKIKKIYKCDMIVDNIDKSNSPIRFFELKKYFKIIFVSSDFKTKKKKFLLFRKI